MARTQRIRKAIDVHAHIILEKVEGVREEYRDFVPHVVRDSDGREFQSVKGRPRRLITEQYGHFYNPERRIRDMDDSDVDIQALSIIPSVFQYELNCEIGIGVSRAWNDLIVEVVKAYPDRFVGLATVPLQDPQAAANELERAMKQLKMKGAEIGTSVNGKNLDAPELWPFYKKAQELNAFIFVHPINVPGAEQMEKYHLGNLIGNPSATSLAIASLIFGGVLEKFPRLKLCFAHAGGFVPYQRGRFEHGYQVRSECKEKISKPPSEYFKLLYFDTIMHYGPALTYLIKSVGSDRVLLGSDYPFDMGDPYSPSSVNSLKTISSAEKRRVLGENAAKLLNISLHD